jgi:hypothetical protein
MISSIFNSNKLNFLIFAVILIPLFFLCGVLFQGVVPNSKFTQSNYLNAIKDSATVRLPASVGDDRFILFGGSSLAWGVSAEVLSNGLNSKVVNTGVHAGVGYKILFEELMSSLIPGKDTIVLSPEYGFVSAQGRLSTAACEYYFLLNEVDMSKSLCGVSFWYLQLKDMIVNSWRDSEDQLYNSNRFNTFGDLIRGEDEEQLLVIDDDPSIQAAMDNQDAIVAWNEFVKSLLDAGYSVHYIPTSTMKKYCIKHSVDEIFEFHRKLAKGAKSNFTSAFPFCFDDSKFFDTAYHLHRKAVLEKTQVFFNSLRGTK